MGSKRKFILKNWFKLAIIVLFLMVFCELKSIQGLIYTDDRAIDQDIASNNEDRVLGSINSKLEAICNNIPNGFGC